MTEFWDALSSNDNKRIGEMQLKVNNARAILKYGPTLVVCYEVLKARGIDAGYPRQPYSLLNDETRKKILSAFTEMGLLHV
jgi:dihydrodipicolinate synthase/N-acetylneuraminate lyase